VIGINETQQRSHPDTQRHEDKASAAVAVAILHVVPEQQPEYDELRELFGNDQPGIYLVFGHVLLPHLDILLDGDGSDDKLRCIFALIEDLITQPHEYVPTATVIEVCERPANAGTRRERAFLFAGPQTRQQILAVEAWREDYARSCGAKG